MLVGVFSSQDPLSLNAAVAERGVRMMRVVLIDAERDQLLKRADRIECVQVQSPVDSAAVTSCRGDEKLKNHG